MKKKLHIVMFVIMAIAVTSTYGQTGINNPYPSDTLDVAGSGRFTGPLKVGNPTAPATQTLDNYKIYDLLPNAGWGGADALTPCAGNSWGLVVGGTASYFRYLGNTTTRSFSRLLTAWFWVPSNATFPYVDLEWGIPTSDPGYDGMYMEYTLDGTTFTKLTPIGGTAYSTAAFSASGGAIPTSCAQGNTTGNHWGATAASTRSEFLLTGLTGKWVRLSIAATNDLVAPIGEMRVYGLSVDCAPASATLNNTFQRGSIYAEKNVYAGSNVLMGDMAEYFKIFGTNVEPGDLISLNTQAADSYLKTKVKNDPNVIGVVSTAPTVTINSPKGSPVALAGRVPVKVTTENGLISIGDYLTASSTSGYAMKANPGDYCIGRAVQPFTAKGKTGKIICLIQNGWFNIPTTKMFKGIKNNQSDEQSISFKSTKEKFTPLPQASEKSLQVPPTPTEPEKFWTWNGVQLKEFIPNVLNSKE